MPTVANQASHLAVIAAANFMLKVFPEGGKTTSKMSLRCVVTGVKAAYASLCNGANVLPIPIDTLATATEKTFPPDQFEANPWMMHLFFEALANAIIDKETPAEGILSSMVEKKTQIEGNNGLFPKPPAAFTSPFNQVIQVIENTKGDPKETQNERRATKLAELLVECSDSGEMSDEKKQIAKGRLHKSFVAAAVAMARAGSPQVMKGLLQLTHENFEKMQTELRIKLEATKLLERELDDLRKHGEKEKQELLADAGKANAVIKELEEFVAELENQTHTNDLVAELKRSNEDQEDFSGKIVAENQRLVKELKEAKRHENDVEEKLEKMRQEYEKNRNELQAAFDRTVGKKNEEIAADIKKIKGWETKYNLFAQKVSDALFFKLKKALQPVWKKKPTKDQLKLADETFKQVLHEFLIAKNVSSASALKPAPTSLRIAALCALDATAEIRSRNATTDPEHTMKKSNTSVAPSYGRIRLTKRLLDKEVRCASALA
jgi:hypothetical protein